MLPIIHRARIVASDFEFAKHETTLMKLARVLSLDKNFLPFYPSNYPVTHS